MNDRVKMSVRRKPLAIGAGAGKPTRVGANNTKEEKIVQRERFRV